MTVQEGRLRVFSSGGNKQIWGGYEDSQRKPAKLFQQEKGALLLISG